MTSKEYLGELIILSGGVYLNNLDKDEIFSKVIDSISNGDKNLAETLIYWNVRDITRHNAAHIVLLCERYLNN